MSEVFPENEVALNVLPVTAEASVRAAQLAAEVRRLGDIGLLGVLEVELLANHVNEITSHIETLVSENEQLKVEVEELKQDKYIDVKTGIASYEALKDFIMPEMQTYIETKDTDLRATRPSLIFGIGDINAMNLINEWVTHTGGDRVIAEVAQALKACVRDMDWVGRFGGAADEFCILLRVAPNENSEDVLNTINTRIDEYVARTVGVPYPVSISFGFVTVAEYGSAEEVVIAADAEMYQKKDAWKKAMRAAGYAISHRLQEE